MQGSMGKVCVCGHQEESHEHYRFGSDCSICGVPSCDRYLHAPWGRIWLRVQPRREASVEVPERPVLRLVK